MSASFDTSIDIYLLTMIIPDIARITQLKKELAAKEARKKEELPMVEEDLKRLRREVFRLQGECMSAQESRDILVKSHDSEIDKIKGEMEDEVCIIVLLPLEHC